MTVSTAKDYDGRKVYYYDEGSPFAQHLRDTYLPEGWTMGKQYYMQRHGTVAVHGARKPIILVTTPEVQMPDRYDVRWHTAEETVELLTSFWSFNDHVQPDWQPVSNTSTDVQILIAWIEHHGVEGVTPYGSYDYSLNIEKFGKDSQIAQPIMWQANVMFASVEAFKAYIADMDTDHVRFWPGLTNARLTYAVPLTAEDRKMQRDQDAADEVERTSTCECCGQKKVIK